MYDARISATDISSSYSLPGHYHQHTQMVDPLSIAASVVGIIVPALHGTRLLLNDLQKLKDAPKAVKRLVEDVHSVDTALNCSET